MNQPLSCANELLFAEPTSAQLTERPETPFVKILHVIGSMDPKTGGPCQGIRNSIAALGQKVCVREVVCLDDPSATYLGQDDFIIHALGPGKGLWCYSDRLVPWLEKNLERFDVVIINGLWLYLSHAVTQCVAKLSRSGRGKQVPKVFVMPHGMLDPYFQRAKSRKLKAVRNWFYWKLIEHRVVNRADGLLFTCETELQLAREPFRPYKPKTEINIGYGVVAPPLFTQSMREAFSQKCPAVNGRPYLLFLSRVHPKKGVDLLLEAYALLAMENKELPYLVVAGPGLDTPYGEKMQAVANGNNELREKVLFAGMLTGDAKWGAFYGCEAFVLPSHQENFGIAVAEALACRKPVLISNQVNIWKEIDAEGAGLVAGDTVEGTVTVLRNWLSLAGEQKRAMGERAFTAYQKHFEVAKVAHKFLDAIHP